MCVTALASENHGLARLPSWNTTTLATLAPLRPLFLTAAIVGSKRPLCANEAETVDPLEFTEQGDRG